MNNAKHTPGPWTVEPRQWDHGASLAIVAPNNGYIVAIVPFDEDIQTVDDPDYETVKRHPDDVPNAHLIAAAPAMYLDLKEGLVFLEASHHDMVDMYGIESLQAKAVWECIESMRRTLAQAEGRE